ncbi:MAG: flagellar motor switch protein FliM [Clostridiales bacterium]|jgi:flagellar motor switch protein FliM|nr:flagellar motor switch protein FliM [Clostridiales bacterium]
MPEILSQSQIDSLLSSLTQRTEELDVPEVEEVKVKEYDFRSPKLFTREQIKLLHSIYENYAKLLSSHITATLQTYAHVEIVEVEEQKYYEFNNALPDSVLAGIIDFSGDQNEEDIAIIDISKDIGFCVIDRLLGGVGKSIEIDREYTEIEIALLDNFIRGMVRLMKNVWSDYLEVTPELRKIETNSRILQGISADDNVVIIVMNIQVNETHGIINLCIAGDTLETIFKKRSAQTRRNIRKEDPESEARRRAEIISEISKTDLEIVGVLGTVEVPLGELLDLEVGDTIKLDKPVDSLIDLVIEDVTWFRGQMGVYKKKKASVIRETLMRRSDPEYDRKQE